MLFVRGAALRDPARLLKGKGSVVRHIVLPDDAPGTGLRFSRRPGVT